MFGKDVEELVGDRANNLEALKGRKWDAVIDESASNGATAPAWVRASTAMLKDSVDQYLFVSTRSVYADLSRVPMTSDAPVLTTENSPLPTPAASTIRLTLRIAHANRKVRSWQAILPGECPE